MLSRSTQVYLVGFVLALLSAGGVALVGAGETSRAAAVALFAGLTFLAPQLYLARTGDDRADPRTRIRFGVLATAFVLVLNAGAVAPPGGYALGGLAVALCLGLVGYELLTGYRVGTASG